jgi:hypothetical protein
MRNCFLNNSDGAGLAWVDETGLRVRKGYFSWRELWKAMRGLKQYAAVLHCRLATNGSVKADNCHPFLLNNGVAVAHNGIAKVEPLEADMTDSESFAIKYIEPWSQDELRTDRVTNLLEQALGAGNKMALLDTSGQITLLNGEGGVEFKDVWFSNHSYCEDRYLDDLYALYGARFDKAAVKGTFVGGGSRLGGEKLDEIEEFDDPDIPCDYRLGRGRRCELTGVKCMGACGFAVWGGDMALWRGEDGA